MPDVAMEKIAQKPILWLSAENVLVELLKINLVSWTALHAELAKPAFINADLWQIETL